MLLDNEYHDLSGMNLPRIPRKQVIESTIRGEIHRAIESTNPGIIDKWYLNCIDESSDIPNLMIRSFSSGEQFLNQIEDHVATILNEVREAIRKQKVEVISRIEKRKNNIIKNKKKDIECEIKERSILKRIQLLPDDLIRYIADFAFTPDLRLVYIKQNFVSVNSLFNTIKSPNLTKVIPSICRYISKFNKIINSINKNKIFVKYKPTTNDTVYDCIYMVRYFSMNKTATKTKKVEEYAKLFTACDDIITYYKQFTKLSYIKLQRQLIRLYHTIIYVANHNCNKKKC